MGRFTWLLVLVAVGTFSLETNLIQPADLAKRVPMKQLSDFTHWPIFVRTPDFVLKSSESEPLFSAHGRDSDGKAWRVILQDAVRGAWQSDVGKSRTYYFGAYTGAAGLGPATWILVLTFDDRRRPVPFFLITHGSYDAKGIEDAIDLDGTGPELLEQQYWGSMRDDPGYYVTTLYQQRGKYWSRSDGQHGAYTFPAFEKWSVMWNRPAELVARPNVDWHVRDSSNDPANGIRTKVIGSEETSTRVIHVDAEAGCSYVRVNVVVEDSARGRVVDLQPTRESFDKLARRHADVVLTGLYRWPKGGDCDASILWTSAH